MMPGTQMLTVGVPVRELERLAVAGTLMDCDAVRLREALALSEGEAQLEGERVREELLDAVAVALGEAATERLGVTEAERESEALRERDAAGDCERDAAALLDRDAAGERLGEVLTLGETAQTP